MSKRYSTAPTKPSKPYPEFPLFPHATGRWAKKIRGKMHYFGPWANPEAALDAYLKDKDALHAGRKPRVSVEGVTVKDLANAYLNSKQALIDAGELSPRTFAEYKAICDLIVKQFGKHRLVIDLDPADFAGLRKLMAKQWGCQRLAKMIGYTRSVFKYGTDSGLIGGVVCFGPEFKRPTKKTLRLHRAESGLKLFAPGEIKLLLAAANASMKAMILLGINCGFGNSDCGNLPQDALDMGTGWINYPRPKTGINRRVPMWPETVEALRTYLAKRRQPDDPDDAALVFLTKRGQSWCKDTSANPVSHEMRKLLQEVGIYRPGFSFYTLRHTFRTIADEAKDQPAADAIMGHESAHMSSHYRERISDDRLKAVTDHVRKWLFPTTEK